MFVIGSRESMGMSGEQRKPGAESLRAGYDTTAVNVRGVALAGVGLVVMLALAMLVAWWLNGLYRAPVQPVDAPFPLERIEEPLPPSPRLQVNPPLEWQAQQEQARSLLNSYEWLDREQGTVRIPVEQAIELLAEEGLPVRKTPAAGDNADQEQAE
jgi:hypothetical protein